MTDSLLELTPEITERIRRNPNCPPDIHTLFEEYSGPTFRMRELDSDQDPAVILFGAEKAAQFKADEQRRHQEQSDYLKSLLEYSDPPPPSPAPPSPNPQFFKEETSKSLLSSPTASVSQSDQLKASNTVSPSQVGSFSPITLSPEEQKAFLDQIEKGRSVMLSVDGFSNVELNRLFTEWETCTRSFVTKSWNTDAEKDADNDIRQRLYEDLKKELGKCRKVNPSLKKIKNVSGAIEDRCERKNAEITSGNLLERAGFPKGVGYSRIPLYALQESAAYKSLELSARMVLLDMFSQYQYFVSQGTSRFKYSFGHCREKVAVATFKRAIKAIVQRGFFRAIAGKSGQSSDYEVSDGWVRFVSDEHIVNMQAYVERKRAASGRNQGFITQEFQ